MPDRPPKQPRSKVLGVAFDNADGHSRLTRGPDFLLAGGSQETHELMQEAVIKVNEKLGERGMRIGDASVEQLRDLFAETAD